ncbi:hypothetical protein EXIGLDRAFT_832896 [Exidia glandulosa HHB12029]|uniref:Cupredoxin n=1 Tax=Exidia glandulosa HHB12029 TaxID=1314781 RepID=A0A165L474_EXIGL|nr:hypothetical protein EXIGLDRAFT_832896 [Exidia glandulosa HHB12029]
MRVLALSFALAAVGVAAETENYFVPITSTAISYILSSKTAPALVNFDDKVLCHKTGATLNISAARVLPPNAEVIYKFNFAALSVSPILVSAKDNSTCTGRMRVGNESRFALVNQPHTGTNKTTSKVPVCELPIEEKITGTKPPQNVTITANDCQLSVAGFLFTREKSNATGTSKPNATPKPTGTSHSNGGAHITPLLPALMLSAVTVFFFL